MVNEMLNEIMWIVCEPTPLPAALVCHMLLSAWLCRKGCVLMIKSCQQAKLVLEFVPHLPVVLCWGCRSWVRASLLPCFLQHSNANGPAEVQVLQCLGLP